jgi:hypothetical protein
MRKNKLHKRPTHKHYHPAQISIRGARRVPRGIGRVERRSCPAHFPFMRELIRTLSPPQPILIQYFSGGGFFRSRLEREWERATRSYRSFRQVHCEAAETE